MIRKTSINQVNNKQHSFAVDSTEYRVSSVRMIFWDLEKICTSGYYIANFHYTANVCRDLQRLCRGFLQYLQGKSCNIYRLSLEFLQSVNIAGKICKYYRIFPADIAENPCKVPVNPCKHLECSFIKKEW